MGKLTQSFGGISKSTQLPNDTAGIRPRPTDPIWSVSILLHSKRTLVFQFLWRLYMLPMDGGKSQPWAASQNNSRIGVWRRAKDGVQSPANTTKTDSRSDKEAQTLSSEEPTAGPTQHPEVRALCKKITPSIGGRARHSSQSSAPMDHSFHPSKPSGRHKY